VIVNITDVESIRDCVIYLLDAIPGSIEDRLIPKHQKSACDTKYHEKHEGNHTQETKWADEPSGKGKFHSHEYSSIYATVGPSKKSD